jgi:hypothetical protein
VALEPGSGFCQSCGTAVAASSAVRPVVSPAPDSHVEAMSKSTRITKKNRVLRVALMGGLLGAIFTNPRKALEDNIDTANQQGWNAIHIDAHATTNLFVWLLQLLVLMLTLGLWTWGAGYLVLLEREV